MIELLVVIAIIAILAAILFPVFAKAREKARQNTCLAHQRQLAIVIMSAAQDNDESLPLPSDWIAATGMTSDAKLFDCPSNSHAGVPSDPDYGMNAFLYDVGEGGEQSCVALGSIEDPTTVELTTDLKGMTEASSGIVAHDLWVNPFPKSYTVNSFSKGSNCDKRHTGGAVVSFLDGHASLLKGRAIGAGMSRYNIPRGYGRFYLDFSEVKAADFNNLLEAMWNPIYTTGVSFSESTKTCNISNGVLMSIASEMGFGPSWMGTGAACGRYCTFMVEGELTEGASIQWGLSNFCVAGCPPPSGDAQELSRLDQAFDIDTANNYIQFGQLKGFTNNTSYPANPDYPVGAWFPLPATLRGERQPITATTKKVKIESLISWYDALPGFPTKPDAMWQARAGYDIYTYDTHTEYVPEIVESSPVTL